MSKNFSIILLCCLCLWGNMFSLPVYAETLLPIRAAYVGIGVLEQRPDVLTRLQQHDFTLALVADGSFRLQEPRWQDIEVAAGEAGLPVMAVVHFAVPQELRTQPDSYRPYVNRSGVVYAKTPCPTDAAYWQSVIGDLFIALSEIARENIVGAAFDAEMYGSDINWYSDLCYCDECWHRFHASKPSSFPVDMPETAAKSRFSYLMRHNLLQAFTTFQWNQVRGIVSAIEQQVHQIRPDFRLGFLCYQHNWFFTALVHGLGTEENPVLVFSESSYVRGYTPYVDVERDHVMGDRQIAEYIPGIWLERFAPDTLPAQLVDAALNTDGYWLYTSGKFWLDSPETETWRLNGSQDAYWSAMYDANIELRRLENLPVVLHRRIPPVKSSSFYNRSRRQLVTTTELRTHLSAALQMPALSNSVVTYRGQALFHCLDSGAGSFAVTHVSLGKDTDPELFKRHSEPQAPVSYRIFGEQGFIIGSGMVTPAESPQTIALSADTPGLVSMLLSSETNGIQVSFFGLACVAEASSTYPLATLSSPETYRVYVPPTTERLNLRVAAPRQESALVTLHPPFPHVAQQISPQWFTELHAVNSTSSASSNWRIQVEPSAAAPFGDVRFHLYDVEFPYVRIPE